jgi:RNA polymerase sigma-54 factor
MKASLQLKISQNLAMTPQLQQAIRLLQLSSLELQTEIQEALESNMMLELDESDNEASSVDKAMTLEQGDADNKEVILPAGIDNSTIPEDLPVDSVWEDIYDGSAPFTRSTDASGFSGYENQESQENTLHDHLMWQLNMTPTTDIDKVIGVTIIDALDDDGYLSCRLEDILEAMGNDVDVSLNEVEAVLRLVQTMEPVGIAARNLQECLALQIDQLNSDTPWLEEARHLIENNLPLLASRDYNQIMRRMKLNRDELQEVITLIQSMNPRPGGEVNKVRTEYIIPDVYVKKSNGVWKVELNTEQIPNLRVNNTYASMIRRADNSTDNNSLKTHLQEARWFIKSLQSRSETLLRVAACIVERQRAFLEYGEEAMKPLVLHDIAQALGMHESTISRVTTRKYMHTPRGIFELKYFFSSHLSTNYGGACSSTAIRAIIKKLISAEKPLKPLSDSKIANILAEQGINVARRTVAKYRETMAIPPSNERKRLT